MKERTNAKEEPRSADESSVVELTPEMALADQSQTQIIELTNALDSPQAAPPQPPPVDQPMEQIDQAVETVAYQEHVDEEPPPPSGPSEIEQEVDAAFEAARLESAEQAKSEAQQGQLLDQLSGLTDMVDNAVREASDADSETEPLAPSVEEPVETLQSDDAEVSGQAEPEPVEPLQIDEEQLARDAALIDSAMAFDTPSDDIIELTDIVDGNDASS